MKQRNRFMSGRRDFLKWSGVGAFLGGTFFTSVRSRVAHAVGQPRPGTQFVTPTFVAFAETMIPGRAHDPTGAPGAIESGIFLFLERFDRSKTIPVSFGVVHAAVSVALETSAFFRFGRQFPALNQREREQVVDGLSGVFGFGFITRLMRASFYSGAVNRVGFDYVGYPGPNQGYPDYSFRQSFANPHPRSRQGNLP